MFVDGVHRWETGVNLRGTNLVYLGIWGFVRDISGMLETLRTVERVRKLHIGFTIDMGMETPTIEEWAHMASFCQGEFTDWVQSLRDRGMVDILRVFFTARTTHRVETHGEWLQKVASKCMRRIHIGGQLVSRYREVEERTTGISSYSMRLETIVDVSPISSS